MIFSKEHKYIYIRVPKTATTTIYSRLQEIDPGALKDTIEFPDGNRKTVHTHITALELKNIFGEAFSEYRVVAFVRDPVSLIASKYHFYHQTQDRLEGKTGGARLVIWLKILTAKILPLPFWAIIYPFKDSAYFILDRDGTVLATDVGSFEQLPEDFARIFSDIGLDKKDLVLKSRKNATAYNRSAPGESRVLRLVSRMKCRRDYKIISRLP